MISTLRAEDAQSTNGVNSASKAEPSSRREGTEEKEAAEQAELVTKTLNPVADLISVPSQPATGLSLLRRLPARRTGVGAALHDDLPLPEIPAIQ
jgi:hypothetical protein